MGQGNRKSVSSMGRSALRVIHMQWPVTGGLGECSRERMWDKKRVKYKVLGTLADLRLTTCSWEFNFLLKMRDVDQISKLPSHFNSLRFYC